MTLLDLQCILLSFMLQDTGADGVDSISMRSFQQEQRNGTSSIVEEKYDIATKRPTSADECF